MKLQIESVALASQMKGLTCQRDGGLQNRYAMKKHYGLTQARLTDRVGKVGLVSSRENRIENQQQTN